MILYIIEAITP